jgi:hypothetical protein
MKSPTETALVQLFSKELRDKADRDVSRDRCYTAPFCRPCSSHLRKAWIVDLVFFYVGYLAVAFAEVRTSSLCAIAQS